MALAIRSASGVGWRARCWRSPARCAASRRADTRRRGGPEDSSARPGRVSVAAFFAEYALLGAFAAVFGAAAGALAAYVIVVEVMGFDFTFSPRPAFAAVAAGLALTVALGMIGAWRILGQKPAAFLREL